MAIKKAVEEPVNKTARRSSMKGRKEEPFKASVDVPRIIPLDGGKQAYLLDPRNGLLHHAKVGSDKWNNLLGELAATEHAPRIQMELEELGWLENVNV